MRALRSQHGYGGFLLVCEEVDRGFRDWPISYDVTHRVHIPSVWSRVQHSCEPWRNVQVSLIGPTRLIKFDQYLKLVMSSERNNGHSSVRWDGADARSVKTYAPRIVRLCSGVPNRSIRLQLASIPGLGQCQIQPSATAPSHFHKFPWAHHGLNECHVASFRVASCCLPEVTLRAQK